MVAEVRHGLSQPQKELPPKYFYDHLGSELFERITQLPEYYLTRTERRLLQDWMPELISAFQPETLVELGAGSAEKTRIILDVMRSVRPSPVYVPLDVSDTFLKQTSARLRVEYPGLRVVPAVADMTTNFELPRQLPRPILLAFLGSTIGNFDSAAAIELLTRVRAVLAPADRFLMGADLRKDRETVEAAYNDSAGVTAEFNRNMLRVLNRELSADFDPSLFAHHAFYNQTEHRIEMHLVALRGHAVVIPEIGVIPIASGESIRTEISCKYDRESIEQLFDAAGLEVETWRTDRLRRFALVLGRRA